MKTIGEIMKDSMAVPVDPRSGEVNLYRIIQMQMSRIKEEKCNIHNDKKSSKR